MPMHWQQMKPSKFMGAMIQVLTHILNRIIINLEEGFK